MNNISIKCLKSEKIQSGTYHGQFLINSLRSGQGITFGNQLRRVLLGDLGGVAISAVRIAGISHEFATIPGVREDILEILLNLKGIVLKSKTKDTQFGRLKIQGPSVITADLIQLPPGLEIVNPKIAVFVKYEFWPNYLIELKNNNIPTILVSGIFRSNQIFFEWYGSFMRKSLEAFHHFFVQNSESKELLKSISIGDATIAGDTRFDRVSKILEQII